MSAVLVRRHTGEGGRVVKYTPCSVRGDHTDEEELDDITPGGGNHGDDQAPDSGPSQDTCTPGTAVTANGPRVPTGASVYQTGGNSSMVHNQEGVITSMLTNSAAGGTGDLSSPVHSNRSSDRPRSRATSRHSLFEIVTNKLDHVRDGRGKSRILSRSGENMGYFNKAHTVEPLTPREIRKHRRKDIQQKFGKKAQFERLESSTVSSVSERDGCKWTFVFDPSGRLAYWWSFVVSIAFLYNFWVMIYRFSFEEINAGNMGMWLTLDYSADLLYVLDIAFHFRTGFLEDGVLQTDGIKLRIHYLNSTMFYIDCLCLLPLDFLYLSIGFKSMLRCFRLVKIYRFWTFLDRTERHTNYPNVVRTVTLLHYLFAIYHWNACLINLVVKHIGSDEWSAPEQSSDVLTRYLYALYWSVLTLTTIGDLPRPVSKGEYLFVIVELVFGLLLFATILGHIANIVTSISTARKDFQTKLDSVKTYMLLRRVPPRLQDRVIRWYDYLWLSKKSSDEEKTLTMLPDKLKAEIALHVHLDTLKRVEIFQNTEAGFLCELVLRLSPVLFSPGDYICTKGAVGKEMYIVNRGRLQVVADNGKTVLATLRAGSYFGEISILNMGNAGNRRTASVRSVGYSDLFCLSKNDLWEVLKDYPTARVRLEAIAVKRLEKYKKQPLESGEIVIPRSKSTPGLVESAGKTTLDKMELTYHHNTMPLRVLTPRSSAGSEKSGSAHSATADEDGESEGYNARHPRDSSRGEDSGLQPTPSADLTNSMTVSSITSYITDTSAQKSPSGTAASGGAPTVNEPMFTPPNSPTSSPLGLGFPALTVSDGLSPGAPMFSGLPSPVSYQGAYPHSIVSSTSTASAAGLLASAHLHQYNPPHLSASHSMYGLTAPSHSLGIASSGTARGSTGSLPRDPPSEILLQEITRLRERLHTLESENAAMSVKLNQQHWEVDHRLSEIEMHMCGSDSLASSSDHQGSLSGTKESVI